MNINELRKLGQEATEGPWGAWLEQEGGGLVPATRYLRGVLGPHGPIAEFADDYGNDQGADARFIATARTAMPLLLDLWEAARRELANGSVLNEMRDTRAALDALEAAP